VSVRLVEIDDGLCGIKITPAFDAKPAAAEIKVKGAVMLVLGDDASGKEDLVKSLAAQTNANFVEVASVMRQEIRSGTTEGEELKRFFTEGKLVPAEMTAALVKRALASSPGPHILTGFPKSKEQLAIFEAQIAPIACAVLLAHACDETACKKLVDSGHAADDAARMLENFKSGIAPMTAAFEERGVLRSVTISEQASQALQEVLRSL